MLFFLQNKLQTYASIQYRLFSLNHTSYPLIQQLTVIFSSSMFLLITKSDTNKKKVAFQCSAQGTIMAICFSGFISILNLCTYANSQNLCFHNGSSKVFDTYFVIFMLLCTYAQQKIGYQEMWLFRWPILIWLYGYKQAEKCIEMPLSVNI